MMPAMERLAFEDLREPGVSLGAGVSAGFLAGVLIGGVGGRLAMLALRLTSDPSLHGVSTDDGFTIGRVSLQTLFLLGVTAGLGMAGGLFYLVVRRWIPSRWRIPLMTLFFALVGGAGLIGPSAVDFTLLSPLPLAVAFFVAIPAVYGATVPWVAERLLREDSILRRGRWAWVGGLLPLLFANIVGALVLLVALGGGPSVARHPSSWMPGDPRSSRGSGRAALVIIAFASGDGLVRDGIDILG
jgi:hypothetical protein